MLLYHGSNTDIQDIDLKKCRPYKDFGKGFYLTPDRTTAVRMAQKKARLFGGLATLITYEMDEAALHSNLVIKQSRATSVLGWATSRERVVLSSFFLFFYYRFFLSFPKRPIVLLICSI